MRNILVLIRGCEVSEIILIMTNFSRLLRLFELFVIFWHPVPKNFAMRMQVLLVWVCKSDLHKRYFMLCQVYSHAVCENSSYVLFKISSVRCLCIFILLAFYLVYLSTICLTLYFIICMLYYCKFFFHTVLTWLILTLLKMSWNPLVRFILRDFNINRPNDCKVGEILHSCIFNDLANTITWFHVIKFF